MGEEGTGGEGRGGELDQGVQRTVHFSEENNKSYISDLKSEIN